MRHDVCQVPGEKFASKRGHGKFIEYWDVAVWKIHGRRRNQGQVESRVVVYREILSDGKDFWTALLPKGVEGTPEQLWKLYHQRSGTIEEYNDQSERAFHLDVLRSGSYWGLNAFHALVALCWNLGNWATEELRLPPTIAPNAQPTRWVAALKIDRSQLLFRAAVSGLRLYRTQRSSLLEIEDSTQTRESKAWLDWLNQPHQRRLRLVT